MHKIESFALSSGSKISKPFINELYFPIVSEKYICISRTAKFPSESYDFFDDVTFHIHPYLEKHNIKIVQIGVHQDPSIYYSLNYNFLNVNQAAYIIRNSLMYVGNLNIYSNIASSFGGKIVCPSKINYIESIKPYWSENSDCKILQSGRKNFKPVSSPEESPKTINEINPEKIAKSILDLLKIKNNLNKIKTLHIGKSYIERSTEVIPNFIVDPSLSTSEIIDVRVDKHFDVNNLLSIAQSRKINIITDQVIDVALLRQIQDNIESISFFINSKTDVKEVEYFSKLGKPIKLLVKDTKNLPKLRVKFLDYNVSGFKLPSKSDTGIKKTTSNMKFLSRKTIMSEGQIYNSNLSESLKKNSISVVDKEDFWQDVDFMRIYEETP